MAKQVYVPSHDMIFDVWGTSVCDCGETKFVVWRSDIGQFDEFHTSECVPYTGEMLAEAKDPEMPMPWKTREAQDAEREKIKSEEAFRRGLDSIAKSREKIIALKKTLEQAVPGAEVKSIGSVLGQMEPGSTIEVALRVTDPNLFYGKPTDIGQRVQEKIREAAEKRAQEGTRIGMTDPRGSGEMDINMGTERK